MSFGSVERATVSNFGSFLVMGDWFKIWNKCSSFQGNDVAKLFNIPSHNHGSLYSVTFIFLWQATLRYIKVGDQS